MGRFSRNELNIIWEKATLNDSSDGEEYRLDDYGNVISRDDYGNRFSTYGWEVDHIVPVSEGGSDSMDNLRPLHWKSNVERDYNIVALGPNWAVKSDGYVISVHKTQEEARRNAVMQARLSRMLKRC